MEHSTIDIVSDKFWYEDPTILVSPDRLTEFFPNKSFSLNEKLNSFVRLGLYISIILIFYYKNIKWISILIFTMIITYYIYINNPSKSMSPITLVEKFDKLDIVTNPPQYIPSVPSTGFNPYYDNIQMVSQNEGKETTNTPGLERTCTEPTVDNPFMNMTMKDYLNYDESGKIRERPDACDTADPEIKKAIDNKFNNNLFKDVNDVFGKFNSERQFHTMPWTDIIPDINGDFKNWLYKTPKTCKEDQDYCLLYEDIRSKRPVINE